MNPAPIRSARRDDIEAIARIDAATNTLPWSVSQHAEELERDDAFVLVAADSSVVAFVSVRVVADEAELLLIAVDPLRQGQGEGGRLLDAALVHARSLGAAVMRLEVRAGNAAALALYASRGFERVGVRRRYYRDNGEDAVLLDCDLRNASDPECTA